MNFDLSFKKEDLGRHLSKSEKKKIHNFLSKMKDLSVIIQKGKIGEYILAVA